MKHHAPPGDKPRPSGAGQRMFAIVVLLVFAGLLWAAWSGRFDGEIQQVAGWLRDQYGSLVD